MRMNLLILLNFLFNPLLSLARKEKYHLRRILSDATITEVPIVGGINTTSAVIGFRTSQAATVRIRYYDNKNNKNGQYTKRYDTKEEDDFTGSIVIDGLNAHQSYWYKIFVNDQKQELNTTLKFTTFPNPDTGFRFSIFSDAAPYYQKRRALSYESGSANPHKDGALFAMQIGDFDHSDPMTVEDMRLMNRGLRNISDGAAGYDLAENILTKMGFIHVWDDHDFCGDDSDKTCSIKQNSLKVYDEYYPGYDRPDKTNGIYHKFMAGDAEIFALDLRFNRDPSSDTDSATKTMLGVDQKQWLKDSLVASPAKWKIIISTVSANKHARPLNPDHWISYTDEAEELRTFLKDNDLDTSTVIVTGDLHTGGALDGGCNNRFNIPELGIAHTNLKGGNLGAIGTWTEGVRDGNHKGYGSIYVNSTNLILENRAPNGFVINSLTLPGNYNTDGCKNLGPPGGNAPGLAHCSTNFASFDMPPMGDCTDVEQFNQYDPPFVNADGGNPISNEVKFYDCPVSDLIIMRSNNIPDHVAVIANPNRPCEQYVHAEFPRTPTVASTQTETDNIQGFALNGVGAFSPLEAGNNNAVEPGDSPLTDAQWWYGHPTAQHVWHYHSSFMGNNDADTPVQETDLLGIAMDGFPIFGPLSDPDGVLDICNFNPETNRYHIRLADQVDQTLPYCTSDAKDETSIEHNWKYILGCYSGVLTQSALKDSQATKLPEDCQEISKAELYNWYNGEKWESIFTEDFEGDSSHFRNIQKKVRTSVANSGSKSVRLRKYQGLSANFVDVNGYSKAKIHFHYYGVSMEDNDSFNLRVAFRTSKGGRWNWFGVKEWTVGSSNTSRDSQWLQGSVSFASNPSSSNDQWLEDSIYINIPVGMDRMKFKFKGGMTTNRGGKAIYLDDISLEILPNEGTSPSTSAPSVISDPGGWESIFVDGFENGSDKFIGFPRRYKSNVAYEGNYSYLMKKTQYLSSIVETYDFTSFSHVKVQFYCYAYRLNDGDGFDLEVMFKDGDGWSFEYITVKEWRVGIDGFISYRNFDETWDMHEAIIILPPNTVDVKFRFKGESGKNGGVFLDNVKIEGSAA